MGVADVFRDLVTTQDGVSHDLGRWSWVVSMGAVLGHSVWQAVQHTTVDVLQLAQAIGVIVAAHGAALWAKKDTEPKPPEPPK